MDERVLLPAERRQVMHDYGEPLNAGVNVYPLEGDHGREAPSASATGANV